MRIFPVLFLLLAASTSHALIEIRAHTGTLPAPNDFNGTTRDQVTDYPLINTQKPMGGDVIITPPVTNIVFGLRYETWSQKTSSDISVGNTKGTATGDSSGNRMSALVGYRFLNLPIVHVGLMAHYGLSQKLKYSDELIFYSTPTATEFDLKVDPSYGAGVEAGASLGLLRLGAEVGYTVLKASEIQFPKGGKTVTMTTSSNDKASWNMSGMYTKFFLGVGF